MVVGARLHNAQVRCWGLRRTYCSSQHLSLYRTAPYPAALSDLPAAAQAGPAQAGPLWLILAVITPVTPTLPHPPRPIPTHPPHPPVPGVGTVIDPSSDQANLQPGARLDLPLWMVPPMAGRNMVQASRQGAGGLAQVWVSTPLHSMLVAAGPRRSSWPLLSPPAALSKLPTCIHHFCHAAGGSARVLRQQDAAQDEGGGRVRGPACALPALLLSRNAPARCNAGAAVLWVGGRAAAEWDERRMGQPAVWTAAVHGR